MAERIRYRCIIFDSARWDAFAFRPDDIVISAPPKYGTTWTQMICALLIFQTSDLPVPLGTLSPFLDMLTRTQADVFAELGAQKHRRFIKKSPSVFRVTAFTTVFERAQRVSLTIATLFS